MEFGERALGNRSILANPKNPAMKDLINKYVKFREEFRPFAPSILKEHQHEYFVCDHPVPFMSHVFDIIPEKCAEIPAVAHVDGTGRLQTVDKDSNELYYDIIKRFYEKTGTPVVLNTSFNVAGEPIVCTPENAIRTFYQCGMDCLVIGNYLIRK
jgi:carbamoyltransferase